MIPRKAVLHPICVMLFRMPSSPIAQSCITAHICASACVAWPAAHAGLRCGLSARLQRTFGSSTYRVAYGRTAVPEAEEADKARALSPGYARVLCARLASVPPVLRARADAGARCGARHREGVGAAQRRGGRPDDPVHPSREFPSP
jgi:hypothetical protein